LWPKIVSSRSSNQQHCRKRPGSGRNGKVARQFHVRCVVLMGNVLRAIRKRRLRFLWVLHGDGRAALERQRQRCSTLRELALDLRSIRAERPFVMNFQPHHFEIEARAIERHAIDGQAERVLVVAIESRAHRSTRFPLNMHADYQLNGPGMEHPVPIAIHRRAMSRNHARHQQYRNPISFQRFILSSERPRRSHLRRWPHVSPQS